MSTPDDTSPEVDEATSGFIERTGLLFESSGGPRAVGRMLGWLLVCDPPHQSAEQLGRALRASTGGVSTSVRWLVRAGYVERFGIAGDRRTYYRMRPHAWTRSLETYESTMAAFRELADDGLGVLGEVPAQRRQRLDDMRDLFAFLETSFADLRSGYSQGRAR